MGGCTYDAFKAFDPLAVYPLFPCASGGLQVRLLLKLPAASDLDALRCANVWYPPHAVRIQSHPNQVDYSPKSTATDDLMRIVAAKIDVVAGSIVKLNVTGFATEDAMVRLQRGGSLFEGRFSLSGNNLRLTMTHCCRSPHTCHSRSTVL